MTTNAGPTQNVANQLAAPCGGPIKPSVVVATWVGYKKAGPLLHLNGPPLASKRGNCTDFHCPFIGMLRVDGIPARFDIGFPLPENKDKGDIAGYHCWAEFYARKIGWIPVDISEAWKAKQKEDYFFGSVDANRVQFSSGRDVALSPKQDGPALNYFVYPYVEVDGKPYISSTSSLALRK